MTEIKTRWAPRRILIEDMGLTVRAYNCLRLSDITDATALAMCTERQLLSIPNMGKKSLDDIKTALAKHGLALRVNA